MPLRPPRGRPPRGSRRAGAPRTRPPPPPRGRPRSREPRRGGRPGRRARRRRSRPPPRAGAPAGPACPPATMRPASRIATRSQTSSTSLSRCELSSTATPRPRSSVSRSRTMRRPTGSSALVGSSRSRSRGDPTSACAIPSRCCIPLDIAPTLTSRASASPTSSSSSARSVGAARGLGQGLVELDQLVGAQPVGKAEQLGEVADLPARRGRAGRRARHLGLACGRAHEAAGDLGERRLAGPVRAEQADELPGLDAEVHPRQRLRAPVALAELAAGEGGRHRAQCRKLPGGVRRSARGPPRFPRCRRSRPPNPCPRPASSRRPPSRRATRCARGTCRCRRHRS